MKVNLRRTVNFIMEVIGRMEFSVYLFDFNGVNQFNCAKFIFCYLLLIDIFTLQYINFSGEIQCFSFGVCIFTWAFFFFFFNDL